MVRKMICGLLLAAGAAGLACNSKDVTGPGSGQGALAVKLTDAALPFDSVKEVNIFVVEVDARRARMRGPDDSLSLNADLDKDDGEHREFGDFHHDSTLWVAIASPNKAFNLLDLQNGVTALLGQTAIDTGNFKAVRLVIDPARSSVVLKDGTVLTDSTNPPIEFENRGRQALFVEFDDSAEINEHATTTIVLDFKLGQSVTLRGRGVRDGLIFRPIVVGRCEHSH